MWQTARHFHSYRPDSQDRAEILSLNNDTIVLIVADGVGGRENGGPAAEKAVALVKEAITNAPPKKWSDRFFYEQMIRAIDDALYEDNACGQTTLVVACLTPQRIVGASVGDSEAWWIENAERHHDLTENSRKPYLGSGMPNPVSFLFALPKTGSLLVATDGVFHYTYAENILPTVAQSENPLERIAESLALLACDRAGKPYDDIAILLARREL